MKRRFDMMPDTLGTSHRRFYAKFTDAHVREYAECVSACSTRMLTNATCGMPRASDLYEEGGAATGRMRQSPIQPWKQVPAAVSVVQERAAFVGVHERWLDSLKALYAFANVTHHRADRVQARRRHYDPVARSRVAALLKDFQFVDAAVYNAAVERLGLFERLCLGTSALGTRSYDHVPPSHVVLEVAQTESRQRTRVREAE